MHVTQSRRRALLGIPLLLAALLPPLAAGTVYGAAFSPSVQTVASVPVVTVVPQAPPGMPAGYVARSAAPVTWPAAGVAQVTAPTGQPVRAGGLPVSIGATGAPAAARVETLDQAAMARTGRAGALLRVSPASGASGPLQVAVDYSKFASAAGGGFGARLQLVRLPDCALTTPTLPQCQGTALPTANDRAHHTVSAQVAAPAAGALVAVTAAASGGGGGDFTATSLQRSATWEAGDSSGSFTWSYPLRTPPGLGGPVPAVALGYESQSLDGLTAATNNQPSWIGDGFAYDPGFIERAYRPCVDDGQAGSSDLCWATDNVTLAMAGHGGELVQDAVNPNLFHPRRDDGTRVERLLDSTLSNGARGGEHWKVTSTDGTQYFFGLDHLPGWSTGRPETASVATVPVYGNNGGEPCNSSAGFAASWCQQAYRWGLDYVVDVHGNSMSYWYAPETSAYARNHTDTAVSPYVRATLLARIDYGTRSGSELTAQAPMRVLFGTADRCVTAGATCTSAQANWPNWPDVPWDQQCFSTTSCTAHYAPTFFTQKRLSQVTTQVSNGDGTWRGVEQWTLGQQWLDPGDGNPRTMFLRTLGHQGLVGAATAEPDITFNGVPMNNRVDVDGSHDPIERFRISSIVNESGGVLSVTYSGPDCVKGSRMPASPDQNTFRCFPAWWVPPGAPAPVLDWFNRYVVTQVSQTDGGLGSATEVTSYAYPPNAAAWHYDESELTPPARRTWGQWRGYDTVTTTHGASGTPQSQSVERYFRGMDGDHTNGAFRSVAYTVNGVSYRDSDWWAGRPFETVVASGPGGAMVSDTLTEPFAYGPTATRTRDGVTVQAYVVETLRTTVRTALDGGRHDRVTQTTDTYDTNAAHGPPGRLVMVDDQGDLATGADDRCTRYTYARNDAAYLYDLRTEAETVGVACAATPNRAVDVLGDERTWYDGATAFGPSASRGDVTRTEDLADWNGGSPVYVTRSTATYDAYGRRLASVDALGRGTGTAYSPAAGGPVTGVTTTDPMGWPTTSTLEPAWGLATTTVDQAGRRTDQAYDGLGRVTAVWLPGRDRSAGQSASTTHAYLLRGSAGASAVTTGRLSTAGTGYVSSYALFDGLLRPRQSQTAAADGSGGRVLTDTTYDSRGLTAKTDAAYYNSSAPGTILVSPSGDNVVPSQSVEVYDGAERQVASIFRSLAVERWRSTTAYGGDRVDVTPPAGGVATSAWTDARGNTVELAQYTGGSPTGPFDATAYGYDRSGRQASLTDPMGNRWLWVHDQRGREVSATDPDSGTTVYTYDDAGQRLSATDARGVTLVSTYDALGRLTAESAGSTGGARLLERSYDALVRGAVSSTTRWVNGRAYINAVTAVDSAGRITGSSVSIPSSEGALAGTYAYSSTYTPDGSVATTTLPAAGGLAAETLTHGYDGQGLPATLSGQTSYVSQTSYDAFGQVAMLNATAGDGRNLQQYWYRDPATQRLSEHLVFGSTTPSVASDTHYAYDGAGNVTAVADRLSQYGAGFGPDDSQCFRYDGLDRLADAWTPRSGDCSAAPSASSLGGAAPYWQTFTYDRSGNRLSQVQHGAAGDTTSTYAYPAGGQPQPHTLTSVTTKGPGGTGATAGYAYDPAGNTLTRPGPTSGQSLTWDPEGHLASVTDTGGATTSYLYDADGNRLISRDAGGATLYLPGMELHVGPAGASPAATRSYTHAGETVAVRSASGLTWLAGDQQGTNQVAVSAGDYTFTKRYQDPFGAPRGGPVTWPNGRTFLDGPADATGLIHLGAREYDAAAGRFLSVDPLVSPDRPQTMNPFAYASDSPVTESDETGLSPCGNDPLTCTFMTWFGTFLPRIEHAIGQAIQRMVASVGRLVHRAISLVSRGVSLVANGVRRAIAGIKATVHRAVNRATTAGHAICYAFLGSLSCNPAGALKRAGIGQPFDCNSFPDAARCRKDLKNIGTQAYRHLHVQGSFCDGLCISLGFQHGQLMLGTGVGAPGAGGSLTWDSGSAETQGAGSASVCGAYIVGPCYAYEPTVDGQGNWVDTHQEYGLAFGMGGVRAGVGYTLVTVDVGNGHVTGPQDPIPPSVDNRLCRMAFWC